MTIYTAVPGPGINQPISNAPSGLGESLSAAFDEGLREGPLMSAIRMAEADSLAVDPNSEVVNKGIADARLQELGIKSVLIPEGGVTKAYLDHLTEEKKESLAKRQIAASAPGGMVNTPLNFMAGLAGAMADPANLAIGLIPFAGEAKAASILGRAGERFVQGARIGGAQTALTIPFTASAAAAEGDDYSMADAMGNIFLSSIGGGLLHAGGGAISDLVRGRRAAPSANTSDAAAVTESVDVAATNAETAVRPSTDSTTTRFSAADLSDNQITPLFERSVANDLDQYAHSRAYDDVIPSMKEELAAAAQAPAINVAQIREESQAIGRQIADLDATLPERTRAYQQQRVKFKDARKLAMDDIAAEKAGLSARNEEIGKILSRDKLAANARKDLEMLSRGGMPETARSAIASRANEITSAFSKNPVAEGVATAARQVDGAHWTVRENAFRAGLSHMLQGRSPDVDPVFAMADPRTREAAMRQIQEGPRPDADPSVVNSSREADAQMARASRDDADMLAAMEDFESEIELARKMTNDIDSPELSKALDDITKEANDDSILKGLQAYATCMLRRL